MKQRLPLVLSATALMIALFGSTPLGGAAGRLLASVVPLANYAKNAGAVDGINAARAPKPGYLVPLGADGKFPASVGRVGPQGGDLGGGTTAMAGTGWRRATRSASIQCWLSSRLAPHKMSFSPSSSTISKYSSPSAR